jgi:arylsulfatase A-like enzyme
MASPPTPDDRPAMFLDLPPSILDLLGLPPHPSFQGISLFEERPNPNRSLYSIVQTPLAFQSALIRSGFKLLYSEWERRYYLWDLVRDAAEQFNIAESRPDIVHEMAGTLQIWRTEQLAYYSDFARQGAEYPPVIAEQD